MRTYSDGIAVVVQDQRGVGASLLCGRHSIGLESGLSEKNVEK